MNQPKNYKYFLLTRYFKFSDGEQQIISHLTRKPDRAKELIDGWKSKFGDWTDFKVSVYEIEIFCEDFLTMNESSHEKILDAMLKNLEQEKQELETKEQDKAKSWTELKPLPKIEPIKIRAIEKLNFPEK